jgi:hypothetical protein
MVGVITSFAFTRDVPQTTPEIKPIQTNIAEIQYKRVRVRVIDKLLLQISTHSTQPGG